MACHIGPHGKTPRWSGGRRWEWHVQTMTFIGVPTGEVKQGKVNYIGLASSNNYSRCWAIRRVSSCMVAGPWMIKAEEYCFLGCMDQVEEVCPAYQRHSLSKNWLAQSWRLPPKKGSPSQPEQFYKMSKHNIQKMKYTKLIFSFMQILDFFTQHCMVQQTSYTYIYIFRFAPKYYFQ